MTCLRKKTIDERHKRKTSKRYCFHDTISHFVTNCEIYQNSHFIRLLYLTIKIWLLQSYVKRSPRRILLSNLYESTYINIFYTHHPIHFIYVTVALLEIDGIMKRYISKKHIGKSDLISSVEGLKIEWEVDVS